MEEQVQQMIDYIRRDVMNDPGARIAADTPLVSGGLIDSFALVDILGKLCEVTGMRIPAAKVQARDMDTVRLMFDTAARVGKPR
jgi:acyl carrier protein